VAVSLVICDHASACGRSSSSATFTFLSFLLPIPARCARAIGMTRPATHGYRRGAGQGPSTLASTSSAAADLFGFPGA